MREEKAPELASGVHNRTPEVVLLEAEDDEGNVEYKLRLKQPNHVRFQQLVRFSCCSKVQCNGGSKNHIHSHSAVQPT